MNLQDLRIQCNILRSLIFKALKGRYALQFLGVWWSVLTPLLLAFLINFIFVRILKIEFKNFPLFVLSAMMPWLFFSKSVSESTVSLLQARQLYNQYLIPKYLVPVSIVFANFIVFAAAMCVMLPLYGVILKQVSLNWLLLPPVMLLHLIFTLGCAMIFSIITVFFRDLEEILMVVFMFWFWITPIFYSINMVPVKYKYLLWLNPMTVFISSYRDILFFMNSPAVGRFALMTLIAVIPVIAAAVLFARLGKYVVKKV